MNNATNTATNITPAARHKARHYAMQGGYQWQMSKADPEEIYREFCDDNNMRHVDVEYFNELLNKVIQQRDELDQSYVEFLQGRELNELDPITLAVLRIASFELQYRIDIPFKVAISEAVSLAKKFGAADSHKFINAVLDKMAAKFRQLEVSAQVKR